MAFKNNIPQSGDSFSVSQVDLLNNNAQLQTSFVVDHYGFTDATADNGKHTEVTTPDQAGDISTAADEPKLYATATTANLGVTQFSRGGGDALPTPITSFHASGLTIVGGADVDILDFAGLSRGLCHAYCTNIGGSGGNQWCHAVIFWTGTAFMNVTGAGTTGITTSAGSSANWTFATGAPATTLVVHTATANNFDDIDVTLDFKRLA